MVEIDEIKNGVVPIKFIGNAAPCKINFFAKDLNTGLVISQWWGKFGHVGETLTWTLPNWDKPYNSGVEIFAYTDDNWELVFQKSFQIKKLNRKYYFSTPSTDVSWDSWESLMYGEDEQILLNLNDVVYDLGANYGVYTMWALSQNVKQVYAFEPTKNLIGHLNETFKWDNNVEIIEKAISNSSQPKTFYTFPYSVSNSLFYQKGEPTEVECIHLEEYIKENNLLPPTIIKCDIEGAEYEFIESCSNEFLSQLRGIFLEYHLGAGTNVWGIVSRFLDLGFSIKSQGPPNEKGMGTLLITKI